MIHIEIYNPDNIKSIGIEQLSKLTALEIELLAKKFPFMDAMLLIKRDDGKGVTSSATYRSLNSLLKSGHRYKIVGSKYGEPKEPLFDIEKETEKINQTDFIPMPVSIEQENKLPIKKPSKKSTKK
jgi:hypothetical protein